MRPSTTAACPTACRTSSTCDPPPSARLTIDPGVTLRLYRAPGGDSPFGMLLGDDNVPGDPRQVLLDAQGTPDRPIVFTSDAAAPAPGDWTGLMLDSSPLPATG